MLEVHSNSSCQLHKPGRTQLSIFRLVGALFKEEEFALGEGTTRGVRVKPVQGTLAVRKGQEKGSTDLGVVGNVASPSALFLRKLYSEFPWIAFICHPNNPPVW